MYKGCLLPANPPSNQIEASKPTLVSPGRSTRVRSSTVGLYIEADRQPGHAPVLARDAEHLFHLTPDLGEVDKAVRGVGELAPLVTTRGVDQLEDKRAARTIPWPRGRKSRLTMLANA
jgi:hypothetical protein